MRVLILNNDFRVYWKGRLLFLHQYLASGHIDLYAVELFGKGSPYDFDSVNRNNDWWSCAFPGKSANELSAGEIQEKLFLLIDKINPDIIIGPSIVFFAGALGLRWAKAKTRKFIMFDDGKTSQIKRNFLVQRIKNLLIGEADGLWLPTRCYDIEYTHAHRKKLYFFYGFDCVDNQHFKINQTKKFNYKTIICVARLVPVKNIDGLLKAWQLVEKELTGYKLLLVGNGPKDEYLKNLSAELELKNIEFAGTIDNDTIPESYFHSDALILPSLWESWGLVVNEAMAAGLPVLLSNKVNAGESLLQEGINGFSFDPLDTDAMAGAVLKFIRLDEKAKEHMSRQSLSIIDEMSYEKMGKQLMNALTIINKKNFRKPGLTARIIIKKWSGKYNTASWDTI